MATNTNNESDEKIEDSQRNPLRNSIVSKLKSDRAKELFIEHFIPVSIFLFLSIFIFRNVIGAKGIIAQGDFAYPSNLEGFYRFFYPMWDDHTSISALARLPRFLFYLPFFAIGSMFNLDTTEMFTLVFIFCEFVAGISMYYSSRYLLRKTYKIEEYKIAVASFSAGLAYMWSYYLIFNFKYPHHRAAYALAPFIVLTLIIGLENKKPKYIILTGFLWCLACMDMHWTVHGAILLFCVIIFYFILDYIKSSHKGRLRAFKRSLLFHAKSSVILTGSFICFSGYWFVPGFFMGGTSRYSAIIYAETYEYLWYQSTMTNLIGKQASYFQTSVVFEPTPGLLSSPVVQNLMLSLGMAVFIFGMMALIMKPKNRYVVFFAFFTLVAIFLSAIPLFSPELWFWFVDRAPLNGLYGWTFKWPAISHFITLSLAFLLGFSMVETQIRIEKIKLKNINLKRGIALSIVCALLLSILLPKWPLVTGDMNGWLMPNEMPDEFAQANLWLEKQEGDFKVLWLPKYHGYDIDWYQGHKIVKDVAGIQSSKPTYVFWSPQKQPNGYGLYFFASSIYHLHGDSMLLNNATDNFGKLLAPLGIKYIVFHGDNATSYSEIERGRSNTLFNVLKQQEDFELIKEFGFIYIFENRYYDEQPSSHFFTTSNNFLIFGGLASLATLNTIPDFHSRADSLIFGNQRLYGVGELDEVVEGIIFSRYGDLEEVALTFADEKYFIVPFDNTIHNAPWEVWSKIRFNHYGYVMPRRMGKMEEWDLDYSRGIAYTWSPGATKADASLSDEDVIIKFDFESKLDQLDFNVQTSNLTISLSNSSISGSSCLMGNIVRSGSQENQFVTSNFFSIPYGNCNNRISLYLAGDNVSNAQVKIQFFDGYKQALGREYIMTESGTFGFTKFEKDIFLPAGTKYFTLEILADHNAITDSYWLLDDLRIYDLDNNIVPARLDMDFDIDTNDNYEIFIRNLKGENGGMISIYLDGRLINTLETYGRSNAFIWEKLGTIQLKQGSHTLAIDNGAGFNAVNLIAVMPEQKMEDYYNLAEEFLKEKELIHILEAESDFYAINAQGQKSYGNMASWSEILRLGDEGEAWFPIQISRTGDYSMSIRFGGGDFYNLNVSLGNNSYILEYAELSDFAWLNITDLHLTQGNHVIRFSIPDEVVFFHLSFEDGWNSTNNAPRSWLPSTPQFSASLDPSTKTDGEYSLKLTTGIAGENWSQMNSQDIVTIPNNHYLASIDIKTENTNYTRVTMHGFNVTSGEWGTLGILVDNLTGTNDWKEYRDTFFVSEDISRVLVTLNASSVQNSSAGNATVWFDNFKLYKDKKALDNEIDFVVLYSNENNQTLGDLFKPNQIASVLEYEKIDGTKYKVRVNTSEPFILAFAEAYDEFWVARIEGEGGEIESIPLYSMLNGFYITKTGDFTVIIEYKPQQWFNIGATITAVSIVGSLGYFIWVDRRMWGNRLNVLYKQLEKLVKVFRRKPK